MTFSIHVPGSVFGSIIVHKISRGFGGSAPERHRVKRSQAHESEHRSIRGEHAAGHLAMPRPNIR
jgi:hypothetical protein